MLNLAICARCSECKGYCPARIDDEGNVTSFPAISCGLMELSSAMGNSDIPKDCLYLLEQRVSEGDAWEAFENLKEVVEV